MNLLAAVANLPRLRFKVYLKEAMGTPEEQLVQAIKRQDQERVKQLLRAGVSVHLADAYQHADLPIREACYHGNLRIVSLLKEAGADLNAQNVQGPGAPLRVAALQKHRAIVRYLLKHGALHTRSILAGMTKEAGDFVLKEVVSLKVQAAQRAAQREARRQAMAHIQVALPPVFPEKAPEPSVVPKDDKVRDLPPLIFTPPEEVPLGVTAASGPAPRDPLPALPPDIEAIDIDACYGVDTNVLDLDLLRLAENSVAGRA